MFVVLGLYKYECRLVMFLMFFSLLLFYCGVVFVYFVVFLLVFGFFIVIFLGGVEFVIDILSYFDFVLVFFLVFGIVFEVFVVIILLCWIGVIDFKILGEKCFYIIVGVFVVGMFLMLLDLVL